MHKIMTAINVSILFCEYGFQIASYSSHNSFCFLFSSDVNKERKNTYRTEEEDEEEEEEEEENEEVDEEKDDVEEEDEEEKKREENERKKIPEQYKKRMNIKITVSYIRYLQPGFYPLFENVQHDCNLPFFYPVSISIKLLSIYSKSIYLQHTAQLRDRVNIFSST